MPNILVTGASGFLGRQIVKVLREQQAILRTCGRSPRASQDLPDYHAMDLARSEDLSPLVRGMDCVIHAAGKAHVNSSDSRTRQSFFETNCDAVQRLARTAVREGVRHFVHISSVSVYGMNHVMSPGEDSLCRPSDAYAASKLAGENQLREISDELGLHVTILRPVTLYGQGDPGNIARLIRMIDRGHFFWIGRGDNRKSLIHSSDAARACVMAANCSNPPRCQVYNLGSQSYSIREIVEAMADALQTPLPWFRVPATPLQISLRLAANSPLGRWLAPWNGMLEKWLRDDMFDCEKITNHFKFVPRISLAEGLREQVEWQRQDLQQEAAARAA